MEERHAELSDRMDRLEEKMTGFEQQIAENTAITQDIKTDTGEFLEVFQSMKSGFKVLGWIGDGAKWIASIGAAVIGLYYAIKMGPRP